MAEALIKAGASRERMEEKMKIGARPKEERKVSSKRKMSEKSTDRDERKKRESASG